MNGHRFSLFLGALVLAAAVQPQSAQAQSYCMTDDFGFAWDISVDAPSDIFSGTVANVAPFLWLATGARGTTDRTIRHHVFTALNPNAGTDPGCGDAEFYADWFTYNGNIAPAGGGAFSFSGNWLNSCGFTGTVTGIITAGACRVAPPAEAPANSPAMTRALQGDAESSVRVSPEGYGVVSRPNPLSDGATITYSVPESADVRLVVYDALGREVATLVDGAVEAGTHSVAFDASSLPAGTYLYRMTAGTHVESGHMAVVR